MEWLKKLRNDIEHYAFDMDLPTVRKTMGRLVEAINEIHFEILEEDVEELVIQSNRVLFKELADEYERDLGNARTDAGEKTQDGELHDCKFCGQDGTAAMIDRAVVCQHCGETDAMMSCCICGDRMRRSDAITWNEDEEGVTDYACDACDVRIRAMS